MEKKRVLSEEERDFMEAQASGLVMDAKEPELTEEDFTLIEEAIEVYNIPTEYIFNGSVTPIHPLKQAYMGGHTKIAIIVTNGGKKITHLRGDKAKFELTEIEITGVFQKEKRIWNKKLKQFVPIKKRDKKAKNKLTRWIP